MPYKVFSEGGKFCVYKHDDAGNKVGKTFGCHPSRKNANAQLRALYASEPGVKEATMSDCPSCGAKAAAVQGVKGVEHDGERYLILWPTNAFQDREGETFETKALEDYVARHDRTGDYGRVWFWHVKGTDFATVVWENVVGRILVSVARMDHTTYADKMWHAINHPEEYPDILPAGWGTSHGYAYPAPTKRDGVYSVMEKFESTILPYHRASNLWGGIKEAVEMARTQEKDDALKRLIGEEEAKKQLGDAEKATSILEQAGISFKEAKEEAAEEEANDNPEAAEEEAEDATEEETEAEEDADGDGETEDDQLYELEVTDELVKEIAAQVDIQGTVQTAVKEHVDTAVAGLKEQIIAALTPAITEAVKAAVAAETQNIQASKEQIVQQALAGKIKLTPWSASQSRETTVAPEHVQGAKESKTARGQQDIVSAVVKGMLDGKF